MGHRTSDPGKIFRPITIISVPTTGSTPFKEHGLERQCERTLGPFLFLLTLLFGLIYFKVTSLDF